MDESTRHDAVQRLAAALRKVAASAAGEKYLSRERCKSEGRRQDPEWLWRALVRSFSTMGGSGAWEKVKAKERWDQLKFERLASIRDRVERQVAIHNALIGAGVRYVPKNWRPNTSGRDKVSYMDLAIEKILTEGGVFEASRRAMNLKCAESKLAYSDSFKGIGPKYARNIWMDMGDEHVAQHVAVDTRVQKIAAVVLPQISNLSFKGKECFVLDAAREAQLCAWNADRLMFGCTDAVLRALGARPGKIRNSADAECARWREP